MSSLALGIRLYTLSSQGAGNPYNAAAKKAAAEQAAAEHAAAETMAAAKKDAAEQAAAEHAEALRIAVHKTYERQPPDVASIGLGIILDRASPVMVISSDQTARLSEMKNILHSTQI